MKILAGNSNRALTEAIAAYLRVPLTKCQVRRFADMEVFVEIQENVRGQDTFIIQSTSFPANDHLMEILIMTDACRRSSARRITAVIPYFGYARQDRKAGPRTPISAKLVANLITHAGADRVLTVDLTCRADPGLLRHPDRQSVFAPVMVRDIKERMNLSDVMVVSPDVGGVVRARALAKRIDAPLAIVDKRRERAGESEVMNIIGDVRGCFCRYGAAVSIHAPAGGATACYGIRLATWLCFNPRARGGRDHGYTHHHERLRRFNPRARGGRDCKRLELGLPHGVSIHAPAGGATGLITVSSVP